jgi:sugar O-acyltransferase (sialic acid O-acetyltransferase NeuD family)
MERIPAFMERIIIIGSGGHAKVIIDIVKAANLHQLIGLIDPFRKPGEATLGLPVLGCEEDLPLLVSEHQIDGIIIGIGDNFLRAEISSRVSKILPGMQFIKAIHPDASIGIDVEIGDGTVIMAGARINPCCRIGRFCILNTNSSLDHDSTMENYSSLAPQSSTGGNCRIGTCAAVSIGAAISHGITIGEHTVIGAGATVIRDVAPYRVAFGVPAKEKRDRTAGEKYL